MSATTFSYAQAARGRPVSQSSPQPTSSPAPSTTGSQVKDDVSTGSTSVTAPSVASDAPAVRDGDQSIQRSAEGVSSKPEPETAPAPSVGGADPSKLSSQAGKTTQEGGAASGDAQAHNEGKATRSTSRTSRSNDSADGRKGRKGKKGRGTDKDARSEQNQDEDTEKVKEPVKAPVLTEAPPPAVNPWAKRMEARKAAVKAQSPDSSVVGSESKQGEDAGTHGSVTNGSDGDKWPQKKPVEASRPADQAPRRSAPRGSRANDKDEKTPVSLPPVADPSSWPDPKSAATREQPIRKPQEKNEVAEKEAQEEAGPTRKKTWERLEIVPSVVFETQLPPLRGSKPRGGARGGREAGSARGSHPNAANASHPPAASSVNDKAASVTGSAGPRTATNRPREGSISARAASQTQPPHGSKRASVDGASRDQHKPSVSADQVARDPAPDSSSATRRGNATRDVRTENGALNSEAGQTSIRTLSRERTNHFHAKGDYNKDGAHGVVSGQSYPARDGRPERGRGGGYRARAGHNGSSGHVPSASFAANGHYASAGGFPARQNPAAHSPPSFSGPFPTSFGHPSRGRGNKWSGSGQSAGRSNAGVTGYPPKAAQLNDFAVPQYPPYMYSPVFDPSVAILKAQVEYYLSVENLCKDYYLRQHMDGQGFAHLSTIAGFKRIKTVTEDLDLLRLACSLSDQIEFVIGDDGIERLRLRDKWNLFVLPVNDRLEAYRNNGPASWTPYVRPDAQFAPFPAPLVPQPYGTSPVAPFPGFPEEQMFQPAYVNGAHYDPAVNGGTVNGHRYGHDIRLTAGVPEYAPPESPVTLESMTNFSDSQVEKLMVILSYEKKDDSSLHDAAGVAGYVSENPQVGQNGVPSGSPEAPSVNGEAASGPADSEPLEQADQSERRIVWLDGQGAASAKGQKERRHSTEVHYTEIRKTALEQRQNAKPGEVPREMQKLYKFWSRMLLTDFNAKVYQEFRNLALEDASREVPLRFGLRYLLEFYDRLLLKTNTRKPWPQDRAVPEIFTAHFNEAVELDRKLGTKDISTTI
ncbi:hypothetical protein VTK56DRAFT_9960 [Thermocarpiscus australiensis]